MVVLLRQLLVGGFIPDAAAVGADLDALGPVAPGAARVGPAGHVDGAGVDDDGLVARGDDGGGDGHGLDGEAGGVGGVVLAELGAEIEVFFALDGGGGGARDEVDVGEPFYGTGWVSVEDGV